MEYYQAKVSEKALDLILAMVAPAPACMFKLLKERPP